MKTEREIREYLADCKKTIKDYDEWTDNYHSHQGTYCPTSETDYDVCRGIVEGLEFVLSEMPLVTKEEQSKLNKIADFVLYQNYPKSSNGIYAYTEAYDIDHDINSEGVLDIEIIMFQVKYGQQDDCHNNTYSVDMKVRRDILNKWDGNGLPQLEDTKDYRYKLVDEI